MDSATFVKNLRMMVSRGNDFSDVIRDVFGEEFVENSVVQVRVPHYRDNQFVIQFSMKQEHMGNSPFREYVVESISKLSIETNVWDTNDTPLIVTFNPDVNYCTDSTGNLALRIPMLKNISTTKAGLKAVLEYVRDTYRKPVSNGCVKAFVAYNELFWVSKRSTSDKVAQEGDKWFLAGSLAAFERAWVTREDRQWIHTSRDTAEFRRRGPEWYKRDLFTPIHFEYHQETDTLGAVSLYELNWLVPITYRSFTRPNGDVVYTMQQLPYATYYTKGVQGYSDKIEKFLEETDLFRLGSVDLYSYRTRSEIPFLGWELEACSNQSERGRENTALEFKKLLDKLVICKSDSSIRPEGFETVSVPATLDFWKEAPLSDALNTMRSSPFNMRSYEHSSCGFHVHVSRTALSVLDLQKMERFMHNPNNRDFLSQVAGRGPCTYATYAEDTLFRRKTPVNNEPSFGDPTRWLGPYDTVEGRYYGVSPDDPFSRTCFRLAYNLGLSILVRLGATGSLMFTMFSKMLSHPVTNFAVKMDLKRGLENYTGLHQELSEDQFLQELYSMWSTRSNDPSAYHNYIRAILMDQYLDRFDFGDKKKYAWNAGLRKSNVTFKREMNFQACRELKGPVGKQIAGRYDVLNTGNQATVEFRLFKGTMNPDSIYRYLEFVDAIVRFVPSTSATDEGVHYSAFIGWLTKDAFNVARYNHLIAFLVKKEFVERSSVRRRDLPVPQENDGTILKGAPKKKKKDTPIEEAPPIVLGELSIVEVAEDTEDYGSHCGNPECDTCNHEYGRIEY